MNEWITNIHLGLYKGYDWVDGTPMTQTTRYFEYNPDTHNPSDGTYGDIEEIDEKTFNSMKADYPDWRITTEQHTVYANGVNQICHTIAPTF